MDGRRYKGAAFRSACTAGARRAFTRHDDARPAATEHDALQRQTIANLDGHDAITLGRGAAPPEGPQAAHAGEKYMALKAIAKALNRSEESTKDRAKADGVNIAKLR